MFHTQQIAAARTHRAQAQNGRAYGAEEACRFLEATVAMAFGLSLDELRAATRRRARVAFARQIAMYVAHVGLGLSLTEVGRQFGRDRTTAAHACRVVEEKRENPKIDHVLGTVEKAVAAWRDMVSSDLWDTVS